MKCPSCSAELKQRERSGYTCSKCKQPFALDPKQNPLRLHDLRLRALDRKLSAEGRLRYTTAQLLHAAAAPVVAAQQPFGRLPIGCIAVLGIAAFGLALAVLERATLAVIVAGGVLVVLSLLRRRATNRPFYRKLPIDQAEFERTILGRWTTVYGVVPPGLLPAGAPVEAPLPMDQLRGALVCADTAVRACLAANGIPARFGLVVLPPAPPFSPEQQHAIAHLRTLSAAPFLVLHDASPAGCLLAAHLRETLGLAAESPVIDLGLNPDDVRPKQLVLGAPPDPVQLVQVRAAGERSAAELEWLAAGNIAPLAGVTPGRLISLIERGMARSAAMPEAQAQQVGFMSWPAQRA